MKKNLINLAVLSSVFIFGIGAVAIQAEAQTTNPGPRCKGSNCLPNPFKGGDSLFDLLKTVVNDILLPIGAILAVLAFIYAGFKYVTARGDSAKIKAAHNTLLYVAIGTAVLMGSWAIASVIQNTLEKIV